MPVPTASQLLDQLMGPNRNSLPGRKSIKRHWSDKDVCKYFLAAFCPNELFEGTKADMGPCSNRHADVLKEHYEKSDKYGELGYEEDLQRYIQDILDDCDRKILKARQRLEQNRAKNKEAREAAELERQQFLDKKIDHLLSKLESLGNQGNVTEAQEVADVIEKLRAEKAAPPDPLTYQRSDLTMEREMDVCEVCGALILIGDTQLRIEDHILGKQHDGYAKLRAQFNLMKEKYWLKDNNNNNNKTDQVEESTKSKRHHEDDDRHKRRRRHDSSSSGGERRSRHSRRRRSSSDDRNNNNNNNNHRGRDRKHSSRRDERRSRRS